nr:MAG TPA: hypothetical protein [Caudoviricetes sp.]
MKSYGKDPPSAEAGKPAPLPHQLAGEGNGAKKGSAGP